MNEKEIEFLCKVFLEDLTSEPSELAEMYQEMVSKSEQSWIDFLAICREKIGEEA